MWGLGLKSHTRRKIDRHLAWRNFWENHRTNKCSVLWKNAKLGIRGDVLEWLFCFVLYFSFLTGGFQLSVTKKGTLCVTCRKGLCRHECSKSSCLCKCSWRRKWVTRDQVVAVSNNKNSTQQTLWHLHQSLIPDYTKSFAFSASLNVLFSKVSV